MSKQWKKILKRRRRNRYLERKKERARVVPGSSRSGQA